MKVVVAVLVAACSVGALLAAPVQANAPRVTRGDAEALFQGIALSGAAIRSNPGLDEGAPAQLAGSIRTTPSFNGRHFCVLDWHLIGVFFASGDVTHKEAAAFFNGTSVQILLDGVPLELETTAIKRVLAPNEGFWKQWGAILSPDELTVGPHTIQATAVTPAGTTSLPMITIHIDGVGTGTCL